MPVCGLVHNYPQHLRIDLTFKRRPHGVWVHQGVDSSWVRRTVRHNEQLRPPSIRTERHCRFTHSVSCFDVRVLQLCPTRLPRHVTAVNRRLQRRRRRVQVAHKRLEPLHLRAVQAQECFCLLHVLHRSACNDRREICAVHNFYCRDLTSLVAVVRDLLAQSLEVVTLLMLVRRRPPTCGFCLHIPAICIPQPNVRNVRHVAGGFQRR